MAANTDTKSSDTNNSHDGFVWSRRLTALGGFVLALALAIAHFAPALAVPLEWQH